MADIFKPATTDATNAIVASAVSSFRALPSGGESAVFYNSGPDEAFVLTGESTVVATLPVLNLAVGAAGNTTPIPVGASINLGKRAAHTHWAAITKAGQAASVYCTMGEGY